VRYIPLTQSDREEMLRTIGVKSSEDLFASIPASIRFKGAPDLPSQKTESELRSFFSDLANQNVVPGKSWQSFLGAGAYEHFIPTVVDAISSRGEFSTAYTPYQPEVSQGTLQAIFEFQSLVANLFTLDVANASMYDGASALAEAVLMAMRVNDKRNRVLISKALHPEYLNVIRSYVSETGAELVPIDIDTDGRTKLPELGAEVVTLVLQQPNFLGVVENLEAAAKAVHASGGLLTVATTEPMAFGMLKGPGSQGADIVAGEGQSFGNALSYGGPYVGLFAARQEHVRQMPGRLVGRTVDSTGKEGYCLTLSTREQHIRRERATSNICTNHSLCALRATVYLALVGKRGLREIAKRNLWAASVLKKKLAEIRGVEFPYSAPTFNEFVIRLPVSASAFLHTMENEKILAGVPLSNWDSARDRDLLVTVTETKNEEALERYAAAARKAL
jgi:glycine dehydrogenase subunit 1